MNIFERIETAKKTYGLNNRLLGEVVGDSEAGFGQIMRRKKMPPLKEQAITSFLDNLEKENPSQVSEGFNVKEDNASLIRENEFLKQTVKDLLQILKGK